MPEVRRGYGRANGSFTKLRIGRTPDRAARAWQLRGRRETDDGYIMKSVIMRKWILYSLVTLSVASWAGFLVTFYHFHDGHLPNVSQQSTGHIYESNNHGHMAYLTGSEHTLLIGLQVGGVSFFLLGFGLNRKWRVSVHPLEGLTAQQRYNVLHGPKVDYAAVRKTYDDDHSDDAEKKI